MTTFLFWNINAKPIEKLIANLVAAHKVDVLILAECNRLAEILEALNSEGNADFHLTQSTHKRIVIYTRLAKNELVTDANHETERLAVRRLKIANRNEILLIATHAISKLRYGTVDQNSACRELARKIRDIEEEVGHSRTILIGDINMNPFEEGMIVANGLHAVMSRTIALRKQRKVRQTYYPFFYNPMWSHFGDATGEPAGSYYDGRGGEGTIFWNMFDQVLIRPDLLAYFQPDNLEILSGDGKSSFLSKKGLPKKTISDHLPILFRLNL